MALTLRPDIRSTIARSTFWLIGSLYLCLLGIFGLALMGYDVSKLTGPIGAAMAPAFVGAGVRAWAKFRHGNGGSAQASTP